MQKNSYEDPLDFRQLIRGIQPLLKPIKMPQLDPYPDFEYPRRNIDGDSLFELYEANKEIDTPKKFQEIREGYLKFKLDKITSSQSKNRKFKLKIIENSQSKSPQKYPLSHQKYAKKQESAFLKTKFTTMDKESVIARYMQANKAASLITKSIRQYLIKKRKNLKQHCRNVNFTLTFYGAIFTDFFRFVQPIIEEKWRKE